MGGLLGALGAGGIGGGIVTLYLDSKQYTEGLAKAEGQTTTMGGALSKLGVIGQTALIALGAAAVKFGITAVGAAVEYNDALLKLNNSIQNSQYVTDAQTGSLIAFAGQLSKTDAITKTSAISTTALAVSFGLNVDQIQKLVPLASDIAAKFPVTIEAAMKALGKSANGTAGSLNRYGIFVDKTAEKNNSFAATVDAANRSVGGFAKQLADEQPWRALSVQINDLEVAVGEKLLPALVRLVPAITDLVTQVGPLLSGAASQAADEIGLLASAFVNADKAARDFFGALSHIPGTGILKDIFGVSTKVTKAFVLGPETLFGGGGSSAPDPAKTNAAASAETNLSGATKDASGSMADTAKSAADLATQQANAAAAATAQKNAEAGLAGGLVGLMANLATARTDQQKLNADQKSGHATAAQLHADQQTLIQDAVGLHSSIAQFITQQHLGKASIAEVNQQIVNQAGAFGLTKSQVEGNLGPIDQWIRKLENVPKTVNTTITADTAAATHSLNLVIDQLTRMGHGVTIPVYTHVHHSRVG